MHPKSHNDWTYTIISVKIRCDGMLIKCDFGIPQKKRLEGAFNLMSVNKTLATVNGNAITDKDVEALLQSLGPQRAAQFQSEEGRKRVLDELINQQLILAEALDNNMEQEQAFQDELKQIKDNVLIQYAIRKLMQTASVSPEEVQVHYEENKTQFLNPESMKASHVLVDDELTANKILKEIKGGMAFEEAANTYSKCASEKNGGDLGYFSRGKMVQEFEDAAFAMQVGQISKPVKTQFGYHIIKVVDKKAAQERSFEEVKDQLTQQLTAMKQNELYMSKSEALKQKYPVKVNA